MQLRISPFVAVTMLVACGNASSPPASDDAGNVTDTSESGTPSDTLVAEAPSDAVTDATPITAPADTWTWIDVPESKCASGTPTGFGVNLHPGSKKLLIYLEGGGSCSDGQGCWVDPNPEGHTAGYGAAEFAKEKGIERRAITSRDPALNSPFLDANLVYIPYCTGDYHSGTQMQTLDVPGGAPRDTYFWGARDLDLFLARIAITLPDPSRVWLAGGSAGGVGTILNYEKVRAAFDVRTDVIDDSGTPLGIDSERGALAIWGAVLPEGCGACTTLENVMRLVRTKHPDTRFALLSFRYDGVVSKGYALSLDDFRTQLEKTLSDMSGDPGFQSFVVNNGVKQPQHVVQNHFDFPFIPAVVAWLTKMANDEPWTSETAPF
jgi:hypothetical protein